MVLNSVRSERYSTKNLTINLEREKNRAYGRWRKRKRLLGTALIGSMTEIHMWHRILTDYTTLKCPEDDVSLNLYKSNMFRLLESREPIRLDNFVIITSKLKVWQENNDGFTQNTVEKNRNR
ncbi:hypothetical protein ACJX0J_021876, partial [Zea mays]